MSSPFYLELRNIAQPKKLYLERPVAGEWVAGRVLVTKEDDFSVELINIPGIPSPSTGETIREKILLSALDISNKHVTLNQIPKIGSIHLSVAGGLEQIENVDFSVVGAQVNWNSLSLESLLESGDTLSIIYIRG